MTDAELKNLIQLAEKAEAEDTLWEEMGGCKDMPYDELIHIFPGYDPNEGTDLSFRFHNAANPTTVKAMAEELLAARELIQSIHEEVDYEPFERMSEHNKTLLFSFMKKYEGK